MCENYMYQKIIEEVEMIPENNQTANLKKAFMDLPYLCKEYAEWHERYKLLCSAKKVLANYLPDTSPALIISDRLYIEFLWSVYQKKYGKKAKKEFLSDFGNGYKEKDEFDKTWLQVFDELNNNYEIKEHIRIAIDLWSNSNTDINNTNYLNCKNIHLAMQKYEQSLKTPEKNIMECVEEVLTSETLEFFSYNLKKAREETDEKTKTHIYLILYVYTIIIRQSLQTNCIKTYTPAKKGNIQFFNQNFIYNLTELKLHVKESIKSYKMLYDEYNEVQHEINEFKELLSQTKEN